MSKRIFLSIFIFALGLITVEAKAQDSEVIKADISGKYETLLSFESTVIAVSCQPSDLLVLTPLRNKKRVRTSVLPEGTNYGGIENIGAQNRSRFNFFASYLKVLPKKSRGACECSFQLNDKRSIQVKFKLSTKTVKPFINLVTRRSDRKINYQGFKDLNVFRKVLAGNWDSLTDITHNHYRKRLSTRKTTKAAKYRLFKTGKDSFGNKVWLFKGFAKRTMHSSTKIDGFLVGELKLSAFKSVKESNKNLINKGDSFYLYLLSNIGLKTKKLLRNLP